MIVWWWQLLVTAVLLFMGRLYWRGWQQTPIPASRLTLVAVVTALVLLWVVLVSPLYQLAETYFFARVIQDLLLVAWIPALLLAANPLPTFYNGLSAAQRSRWEQFVTAHPGFTALARQLNAGAAWLALVSCFWFWYDHQLHQATLVYGWIRPFQIGSLLFTALVYWWHITAATPRLHPPMPRPVRIFYAITGAWAIKGVGFILLFSTQPLYQYPASAQSVLGVDDYGLGTILMWMMGGIVYSTTATLLMRAWLAEEEVKPPLPVSVWSSSEALMAPGFDQQ